MWEPPWGPEHWDFVLVEKNSEKERAILTVYLELPGVQVRRQVCESRAGETSLGRERLWVFKRCEKGKVGM